MNFTFFKRKSSSSFDEFDRVKAIENLKEGDRLVPSGATGTIVYVYDAGAAFEVEFTAPAHVVIFARKGQLIRI